MFYNIGEKPGKGTYECLNCSSWRVAIHDDRDRLPPCGNCGAGNNVKYRRSRGSLVATVLALAMPGACITIGIIALQRPHTPPADPLAPIVLLVVGFLLLVYWFLRIKSPPAGENIFHWLRVFILGITLLALWASGLFPPSGSLSASFREMASVLILLIVSEIGITVVETGVHAGRRLENLVGDVKTTHEGIQALQASLNETGTELTQVTTMSREHVERMVDATEAFANLSDGDRVPKDLLTEVWRYFSAWTKIFKDQELLSNEAKRRAWMDVFKIYVDEECRDIRGDAAAGDSCPVVATNTRMYLRLLRRLAESIMGVSDRRKLFLWGITNVFPEFWYNWETEDGQRCRFQHIDDYREVISKIVQDYAPTAEGSSREVEVKRWILADGGREASARFLKNNRLLTKDDSGYRAQKDLFLYFFDKSDTAWPHDRAYDGDFLREVLGTCEWLPNGQMGYCIATKLADKYNGVAWTMEQCNADAAIVGKAAPEWERATIQVGEDANVRTYSVWRTPLWRKFVYDLHSKDEFARSAVVEPSELALLPSENPDLLLVGYYDEDGNREPVMAISARLRFGADTTLLRIISSSDRLEDILQFTADLEKHGRAKALSDRCQ